MIRDFSCPMCGNVLEDWYINSNEEDDPIYCDMCDTEMVPQLFYSNRTVKGESWYEPGVIDRFEIEHTDKDGKTTTIDARNTVSQGMIDKMNMTGGKPKKRK